MYAHLGLQRRRAFMTYSKMVKHRSWRFVSHDCCIVNTPHTSVTQNDDTAPRTHICARRLRALGLPDFSAYLRLLEGEAGEAEREQSSEHVPRVGVGRCDCGADGGPPWLHGGEGCESEPEVCEAGGFRIPTLDALLICAWSPACGLSYLHFEA